MKKTDNLCDNFQENPLKMLELFLVHVFTVENYISFWITEFLNQLLLALLVKFVILFLRFFFHKYFMVRFHWFCQIDKFFSNFSNIIRILLIRNCLPKIEFQLNFPSFFNCSQLFWFKYFLLILAKREFLSWQLETS